MTNKDMQTKEYLKKLDGLKLSDSSRTRMESSLLEYARFHGVKEGVRVTGEDRFIERVPQRTSFINQIFNLNKKSMTAAIIAIALIFGGGTSYAAEGAVPGDFLYSVKTDVNENIKSAFAVSNKAEARLQARLAEERLVEAEELAARGQLTAEASVGLSSRLKSHYNQAETRSEAAETSGDFETSATVRASLEGSLRTYADVIANLNTQVSGNNGASLVSDIRAFAEASAKSQTRATVTIETSLSAKAASEATIKRADRFLAEVETKLARVEGKISAEAYTRAEAKFSNAVAVQVEAKAAFQAEAYAEAYSKTQTAIRIASELDSMINSMLRLKIDVNASTDNVINGVINVTGDSETREETETESNTNNSSNVENDTMIDANVESSINADVDTGVIRSNVNTEVNTNIRSGLNL